MYLANAGFIYHRARLLVISVDLEENVKIFFVYRLVIWNVRVCTLRGKL